MESTWSYCLERDASPLSLLCAWSGTAAQPAGVRQGDAGGTVIALR